MVEFLYLILALAIIFLTYLIFQAVGGVIFGGKIDEIGIFNGPSIFKIPLGKIVLSVNYFPTGSYVRFTEEFRDLHPIRKILIALSGLVSYFVLTLICLGFSDAIAQTISGYIQIVKLVFSPIAVGAVYIGKTLNLVNEKSFMHELGVVAAKSLAVNSLPFGNLVLYFLELLGFKSESFSEKYQILSLFLVLIIMAAVMISFIAYFFKG